jgi:hypothetical protein
LLAYLANAGNFSGTAAELAPNLQDIDAELKERLSPNGLAGSFPPSGRICKKASRRHNGNKPRWRDAVHLQIR